MKYVLAIDIGASSGRHIVGWEEDGKLQTEEVYRFPNGVVQQDGHLLWNLQALEEAVRQGIQAALQKYPDLSSLSIDTWGVDYVLMKEEKPILPAYAYRDHRTEDVLSRVHERIPFAELYRHTGIQFQPFNTLYQLYADLLSGRLQDATDYLMIPEYLMYRLCGTKAHEYTNATTGGLVNAATRQTDPEILHALGLPERLFSPLEQPGKEIGSYLGIPVVLCATHDTASAVEGIPMEGNCPYLSSGTWSLLGIKVPKALTEENSRRANYSNEGGIGYFRYQKNIMGMWLINSLRQELTPNLPFGELVNLAENSHFSGKVNANDPAFLSPSSMKRAFDEALGQEKARTPGDYFRCACLSLAHSYREALGELERNTGISSDCLYIVGGGARNQLLNRMTQELTGKEIRALPIEATALGNLWVQLHRNGGEVVC